jgi:hypothetical protein
VTIHDVAELFLLNGRYSLTVYKDMFTTIVAAPNSTSDDICFSYQLFVAKTTKYSGILATNDIYQEAIELFLSKQIQTRSSSVTGNGRNSVRSFLFAVVEFARMEANVLHQIDHSQSVYGCRSNYADPRLRHRHQLHHRIQQPPRRRR